MQYVELFIGGGFEGISRNIEQYLQGRYNKVPWYYVIKAVERKECASYGYLVTVMYDLVHDGYKGLVYHDEDIEEPNRSKKDGG